MNITEKSKQYAEGKALSAITTAIEQAYADGFADGYREARIRIDAISPSELNVDVKYVDLGLPSGTLWSSGYVIKSASLLRLPYIETTKLNIPTKEQFCELYSNCQIKKSPNVNECVRITGTTGEYIDIPLFISDGEPLQPGYGGHVSFWLKDKDEGTERNYARFYSGKAGWTPSVSKMFMGNSLPVLLVL